MSANSLRACVDVLTSPASAFDSIKSNNHKWLVPFLLVTGSIAALFLYYFSAVDFAWLKEGIVDQMAVNGDVNEDELAAASQFISSTSMLWSSLIGGIVAVIVMNAILALYLNIVTKSSGVGDYSYGTWFGFSWWVGMPHVVAVLLSMLMVLFSGDGMVALEDLSVTTLNSLIFNVDMTSPWFSFLSAFDLLMLWSIGLIAIGLKSWVGFDISKASKIAIAPYALIYGVWALMVVFSA